MELCSHRDIDKCICTYDKTTHAMAGVSQMINK